ncbi:MAG: efflux RND transporter periplasmic adaptor subunit [Dissulfurimicrobium sp.]|uniref:efflux RND transporter periplasmic adaptor subunit n=1 Tax=Dissulfurimicrobium TaxID=1769732 RepID=UPI001EDB4540|nr:efflux RND transporter periplasmic adaptor subunit [Dissulfurimicrobium hydrothermale]UKL12970.1 efflux RND transporter periplasmic adaptor subunit [Dissulfurimicrobium hydrothermale]
MKKIIAILVALVLIGGAIFVIKKKKDMIARTPAVAAYPLPVEAAVATRGDFEISSHYLGTIQPFNYADIAPRITGSIISVRVREGDVVHKGDVLVIIDDRELREKEQAQALQVAAARSQLAGVKSACETQQAIFERDETLYKEGAISKEAFERSRAQRDLAVAQVKSLEDNINALQNIQRAQAVETSYAVLSSPMDGVVAKRLAEPGDLAVPGRSIVRVEGTDRFKLVVQIPETEMPLMKKGGKVVLSNGKDSFNALISRVYPAVGTGTLGSIEIDLTKRPFDCPSGGTVGVDVITGDIPNATIVPLNALLEDQSGSFVYKIEVNNIKVLKVAVLGKNADHAAIRGDIKDGDMVVTGDEGKLMRLSGNMTVIPQKAGALR